jgi:phosphopantetheinyl transferase
MMLICFGKIPTKIGINQLSEAVRRAFSSTNEQYIEEIERRGDEQGKIHSLAALLCLKTALDTLEGDGTSQNFKLARAENGKPYFENSALQFGLSHSHGYVACVLSNEGAVGIDVEATDLTDERAAQLSKRFFGGSSITRDAKVFAREWTKKEAEVKLYGGRLGEYLAKEKTRENPDNERKNVFFTEFEIDGYPITLCTETMPSEIQKIDVKFDF